ncbi:baseplate wedge subunit / tail lysozyme [Shewanella phage Thanatos-2]|nr:baseplate wedge subunit / tail lysozyme [Shewanella phage Thanatos-2]
MITDELYVDLDPTMQQSWNLDVASTRGLRAVRNSMVSIITTKKGSRPFYPEFGCDINEQLFENMTVLVADTLERNIISSIKAFEPRVDQLYVNAIPSYESNAILVEIRFSIIDNPDVIEQLKLELRNK